MAATTITRMEVRRPDGTIETVEREGSMGNSPIWRTKATEATRAAGRGDILSFEVIDNPATMRIESATERLRRERRELVSDIQAAIEDQADAFERAHAREDVLAWNIKASHEPKIEAARTALAAFDAEHPEIIAQIRAEKSESATRHMWD
jgi:hypothetical protein